MNEINITKKIGFHRSDDINWITESWMIYLYTMIVLLPTENKILEIVVNCEPFTRLKMFCENLWIFLNIYIF